MIVFAESEMATVVLSLESYKFFEEILKAKDIKPDLLAVSKWNKDDNQLTYNSELYDQSTNTWIRKSNSKKQTAVPSNQEAFEKFDSIFDIENSDGFLYLSIEHESPFIARDWLEEIIHKINELVMKEEKQTLD